MRNTILTALLCIPFFCSGQWNLETTYPASGVAFPFCFTISGKAYIGSGFNASYQATATNYEYTAATNSWETKSVPPFTPRMGAFSFSIGTFGYVGSGSTNGGSNVLTDFWRYEPTTDTWLELTPFPGAGRIEAAAFVINGKAYVVSGIGGGVSHNDCWEYDPTSDTWTQMSNPPSGFTVGYVTGFSHGNFGYVGIGGIGSQSNNDFWRFDPSSDTWLQLASLPSIPTTRAFCIGGVNLVNGKGFVGLGSLGGTYYADFWIYDFLTDTWQQASSFYDFPYGVVNARTFTLDGKVYAGTGQVSGVENKIYKFTECISDLTTSVVESTITSNNTNATYQWLDCDNDYAIIPSETEQDFSATTNGNYAVEITENGCVDTSECVFIEVIDNCCPIKYTELTTTPFEGVQSSSIAFADVNGDQIEDVLVTGLNASLDHIAKLYVNDGLGGYTETATPFDGVHNGSVAFADVDGDLDQDVLITGYNTASAPIAKLYINDGSGVYTVATGTPFDGVWRSSIAFTDVDGMNGPDVLITGRNTLNERVAKLYLNNGTGAFTEVLSTPFDGVHNSSIAFADVNGDTYPDVLITGENALNEKIAKLYINDGSGGYTEAVGAAFEGVYLGSIAFSDVDGMNGPDVLITGYSTAIAPITKLYMNYGTGAFTESIGAPFDEASLSSIAFADMDGDQDQDVLITGYNTADERIAKVYENNGTGLFNEIMCVPFDGVRRSSIAFADVDGDLDQDVLITGQLTINEEPSAKMYLNQSINVGTSLAGSTISASNTNGTYQWLDCGNGYAIIPSETVQNFTASESGNYAVEITENGCVDTSSCVAVLTVDLLENVLEEGFIIYPNPTNGQISVAFESNVDRVEVSVVDVMGKLISSKTYSNATIINLEINESAGVYYVELATAKARKTIKVVKQ